MDNNQFLLGNSKIDSDHQILFALIDRMTEAMGEQRDNEELESILKGLRDYTVTHFRLERDLMQDHNYEGLNEHLANHSHFVRELGDIQSKLREDSLEVSIATLRLLRKWLLEHIMVYDKRMVDFFQQNQKV